MAMSRRYWREYPSIDDKVDLDKILRNSKGIWEFVAIENVDGCNFAFECTGDAENILYYSRKKRIDHHANFVGKIAPRDVMHVYHEPVVRLYQNCRALESVVLYGEYFGGWHPGGKCRRGWPRHSRSAACRVLPGASLLCFRHFGGW